jgi:hypothetical protein
LVCVCVCVRVCVCVSGGGGDSEHTKSKITAQGAISDDTVRLRLSDWGDGRMGRGGEH